MDEIIAGRVANGADSQPARGRAETLEGGLIVVPARPEVPDVSLDAVVPSDDGVEIVARTLQHGIPRVRRGPDAVRREEDADAPAALAAHAGLEPPVDEDPRSDALVATLGVLLVRVLVHHAEPAHGPVDREDVVLRRAFELDDPELRPLPVDSVPRKRETLVVQLFLVLAGAKQVL